MRLVSWNVNGLRAVHKKGNWGSVWDVKPDFLALQEVKASPEQLPQELQSIHGFHAYFSPCKVKRGYSGVALYCREEPEEVINGMGIPEFDDEGRIVGGHFADFTFLNVYFPNGQRPERLPYKFAFYEAFIEYLVKLRNEGRPVIFCGDGNIAHTEIDVAKPTAWQKYSGFLPEERKLIDRIIDEGFIDVFRTQNPSKRNAYSYWDVFTGARDRNEGWRIDYFFVSDDLEEVLEGSKIHDEVYGSDHCPVSIDLRL